MRPEADGVADDVDVTGRLQLILSDLEEADYERTAPPADLWDRIEASIAPGPVMSQAETSPKRPPAREPHSSTVIEYWIDANDVVSDVGQSWADFARNNDAPELAAMPSGRTLWTYFDSDEVGDLWRLLVERVRGLQQEAHVPLRCDAPDARRWFEMTVTPEPDHRVHFRCESVFEEARSPISLLDPHSERDADLQPVPLCGWCGRAQHDSRWIDVEELVRAERLFERESIPPISQGICASCRNEMSAELLVPSEAASS